MPLTHDDKLNELLRRWEEQHLLGESPTAESVCRDCPEYIEAFRACIFASRAHHFPTPGDTTVPEPYSREQPPLSSGEAPEFDGYEVLGILGSGGMGVVYKAWEIALKRMVALKTLRPHPKARPIRTSRAFAARRGRWGKCSTPTSCRYSPLRRRGSFPTSRWNTLPGAA